MRRMDSFKIALGVSVLGFALSACTTTDEIIIDEQRSNMANYDRDLASANPMPRACPWVRKPRVAQDQALLSAAPSAL